MQEGSLASPEGVLDVSIIAVAHFDNPLRPLATELLREALSLRKRCIMPLSTFLGAYHVLTRYLRVNRGMASKALRETLTVRSPAFYCDIPIDLAVDSLDYAATYDVESWDGYLVGLAINLNAKVIYTLDEKLRKVREITVTNPFPVDIVKKYHRWLDEKLKEHKRTKPQRGLTRAIDKAC